MRKLIASDVFAALRIVSAIEKKQGIETTIKDLVNETRKTKQKPTETTRRPRNATTILFSA